MTRYVAKALAYGTRPPSPAPSILDYGRTAPWKRVPMEASSRSVSTCPRIAAVVIDAQSPAMVLLSELKSRGMKVMVNTIKGMGQACGCVLDMLTAGTLKHLSDADQPQLATAVANATTRPIGKSSAFGWNKTGSDIDISPLIACTMALQGAWTTRRNPNRRQHVMH